MVRDRRKGVEGGAQLVGRLAQREAAGAGGAALLGSGLGSGSGPGLGLRSVWGS